MNVMDKVSRPSSAESDFLGENLIFLISQPRAGSTLLQKLCSNHPNITTSSESWIMLNKVYALRRNGIETEYNAVHARNALMDFLSYHTDGLETYYKSIRASACVLYQKAMHNAGKTCFLDKTPRYYLIIPELYQIFPKARFIFLLRNPLSVLASILSSWAKGYWPQLGRNKTDLIHAPVKILEGIRLTSGAATVIHYEDLISNPEQTLSTLFRILGQPLEDLDTIFGGKNNLLGRMGDLDGSEEYTVPNGDSLLKWQSLTDSAQTQHFAQQYLNALGEETVSSLGYDFNEMTSGINGAKTRAVPIVPWELAVKQPHEKSWLENHYIDRVMALQATGQYGCGRMAWHRLVAATIRLLL